MSARGLALDDAAWASPWRTRRVLDKAVLALGLLTCAVSLPPLPGGVLAGAAALVLMLGPARVRPRLTTATGVPAVTARRTNRYPERTVREDPTTTRTSEESTRSFVAWTREAGTFSPK